MVLFSSRGGAQARNQLGKPGGLKSFLRGAGAQPGGGIWGICPPEIFKTLHRNFDIFAETFKE